MAEVRHLPDRSAQPGKFPSWSYWRQGSPDVVEICHVRGSNAVLPTHFHDEDQLVFVLAGQRRLLLCGEPVTVPAGRGLLIPAGQPHQSLRDPSELVCLNIYLSAGRYAASALLRDVQALWRGQHCMPPAEVVAIVGAHRRSDDQAAQAHSNSASAGAGIEPWPSVGQLAAAAGMSREGYTRQFSRRFGMSPHAYRIIRQLNDARRMLRAGVAIADAAVESGFADQSHFGRWFRRAFGNTPGRYLRG
jgi:AraC-like DNA-binding protein